MERAIFHSVGQFITLNVFLFQSFVGFKLIFEHCSFLMSVHQTEIVTLSCVKKKEEKNPKSEVVRPKDDFTFKIIRNRSLRARFHF